MKKLLMISGDRSLAEGKHGAFYNTLEEFHKHWERIDVIVPKVNNQRTKEIFDNVFIHSSPWSLVFQPLFIWKKGKEIQKHYSFDLITVHDYAPFYNGIGAYLLYLSIGVPYVLEVMHIPGFPKAGSIKEFFYKYLTKFFIHFDVRYAKAVRVINKEQTKIFLVNSGVPVSKIRYIPAFYIDLETFRPTDIPKRYDAIFIGRLVRNKGIGLFLDIVRGGNLTALIVGDGLLLKSAKGRVIKENLQVDFHGYARDSLEIANLINQSRLLLMTSLNEGGPRVILEALACGVPVVATPVGIVPDVLPSECIEKWNAPDMVTKIKNLLTDAKLYHRVREAGFLQVKQFERSKAITEYADGLKEIIEQR